MHLFRKNKSKKKILTTSDDTPCLPNSISSDNIKMFQEIVSTTVSDYYISEDTITYKNTLRHTEDLVVYEGEWRYEKVCVKKILYNDNLCNELFVLSKCIHPKVVQFLGFYRKDKHVNIVFEYMENGNLIDYMLSNNLSNLQKVNIMLDIAIALHYLHNRYPAMVIHRDIKPTNILIDIHGNAKLSDFGISKLIQKGTSNSRERGTYTWMAPEVLIGTTYNHLVDIYSLGLVMYYIWTEKMPFDKNNFSVMQLVFAKLQYRIDVDDIENNDKMNALVKQCTQYNQHERPDTESIINQLKEIKSEL